MKKTKKILLLSLTALFINIIPINLVFSYGILTLIPLIQVSRKISLSFRM